MVRFDCCVCTNIEDVACEGCVRNHLVSVGMDELSADEIRFITRADPFRFVADVLHDYDPVRHRYPLAESK
jgi:hypothetical protein